MPVTQTARTLTGAFADCFDRGVRQRGESYLGQGRVKHLTIEADQIGADVQGTQVYDVFLDIEKKRGEWRVCPDCMCEYACDNDSLCKHVWALMLAAEREGLGALGAAPDRLRLVSMDGEELGGSDAGRREPPAGLLAAFSAFKSLAPRKSKAKGAKVPKPKPPEWQRVLDRTPALHNGYRPAAAAPIGAVTYVLSVAETLRRDSATLILMHEPAAGKKLRRLAIQPGQVRQLVDAGDRVICAMLIGSAKPGNQYGYSTYSEHSSQGTAVWRVDSRLLPVMIPLLAQTGRFHWQLEEHAESQPIQMDEGKPWEFALACTIDAKNGGSKNGGPKNGKSVVRPTLRRGAERVSPDDVDLVMEGKPGLVLRGGVLSFVVTHDCTKWLRSIQEAGPIEVQRADAARFLGELGRRGLHVPVEWPEGWGMQEISGVEPRPELTLKPSARGELSGLVDAAIAFRYDESSVKESSADLYATSGDAGVLGALYRRDAEREQSHVRRFLELGAKRDGYYSTLTVAAKKVPKLVAALLSEGWEVRGQQSLYRRPGEVTISVSSGIDWFNLSGHVEFGGVDSSIADVLSALKKGESFVTLGDGSLGLLPEAWLARHGRWLNLGRVEGDGVRFSKTQLSLIDAMLAEMPGATCDAQVSGARKRLAAFEGVKERTEPSAFTGTLRPYQREGLGWLEFLSDFGFGGCLADDMGLGKTVQLLAHLADRRARGLDRGPWLIVAPRSVIFNWSREAARFTPQFRVVDYTGKERRDRSADFLDGDIVLTTYGTLRLDIEALRKIDFAGVVLDEAQAIKNAASLSAKAARLLRAPRRLALTGTPIENRLEDLWSIFEFLNPGMLGSVGSFAQAAKAGSDGGEDAMPVLRRAIRPFMLRRTKARVAPELPERSEQTIHCVLEGKQRVLYDSLLKHYRESLLGRIETSGMGKSRIHVLEALLRLRQAACHPALIEKKHKSSESAKVRTLVEMLEETASEGHKALVFSQFTSLLAHVRTVLDERGITMESLDGGTSAKDRASAVDRFQSDPSRRVFLISLKAGGVGLNLTAADYVFLLDPWWNPAVEAQAIDRTHRIGQSKKVFAYRLVAKDTIEERILELQQKKRELADAIVAEREGPLAALTRDELAWLLS